MDANDFFYVQPEDVSAEFLILRQAESHHLLRVCRKRIGDRFVAADGCGHTFVCQVEQADGKQVRARILKRRKYLGEPYFHLTTALAVPKKARFEWFVEKGTELGVSGFVPLITHRTVVKGDGVKVSRLERIALAALKQCQRSVLPKISQPQTWEQLMRDAARYDVRLLAHEKRADQKLETFLPAGRTGASPARTGLLCIGPEGGFTEEEVAHAEERGFGVFGLGPRRLRAETAALVAATIVLDRMGELS